MVAHLVQIHSRKQLLHRRLTKRIRPVFNLRITRKQKLLSPDLEKQNETGVVHHLIKRANNAKQLLAAKRFGIPGSVTDVSTIPGTPGNPAVVRLTTAAGSTDVRLGDVRARLGLKSTGFRIGVLRLDGPTTTAPAGKLRLTGLVRNVEAAVLERRGAGGVWAKVKKLEPAGDGTFAVSLRLDATSVFRLTADGLSGPALTVRFKA